MSIPMPEGIYHRDNTAYKRVCYRPGKALQSAELNDMQLQVENQFELLTKNLYKDGTYVSGGTITYGAKEGGGIRVTFAAGTVYALGFMHEIATDFVDITGVGVEKIYLTIVSDSVDEEDDPTLLDPAIGAENYGYEGAIRQLFLYDYVLNDPTGILVATFIDGVLVTPPNSVSNIISDLFDILAQRTYEQSGHFVTTPPTLILNNTTDDIRDNPEHIALTVDGGIAYVKGYRNPNTKAFLPIKRPMAGGDRIAEPVPFATGTKVYTLDNPTILSVTTLQARLQSPSFNTTKGTDGGSDPINALYQPTASIVSVSQSPHGAYDDGVDYELGSGDTIDWIPAGEEPTTGSTYQAVVQYIKNLAKGIRVYTTVSAEAKTVTAGAFTLSHTDIADIVKVEKSDLSVTYIEGDDFTVTYHTGVFAVTGIANATNVLVTYHYWNHTVEGDFCCRDSFRDGSGNIMYNNYPTKTISGVTVDYKTQISFDNAGGLTPVDETDFFVTYKHALGRVDVLVWKKDNTLDIVEGSPAFNPVVPPFDSTFMPIAKFLLAPEATASSGVKIERYNNQTLLVTQLRHMLDLISDLQYNLSIFQLQAATQNITLPTDKRGIFADDFSTNQLADSGHEDLALSWDFLARTVALPRESEDAPLIMADWNNDGTMTQVGNFWMPTYTESLLFSQPYRSTSRVINAYDSLNFRAISTLSPANDTVFRTELAQITTSTSIANFPGGNIKNNLLLSNISPETNIALKAGKQVKTNKKKLKPWEKVPVNVEWTSTNTDIASPQIIPGTAPADAPIISQDKWATVLSNSQVVIEGFADTREVQFSGQFFTANCRAISCEFNDVQIPLSADDSDYIEGDSDFPGCLKADADGNVFGKFTVPEGTPLGSNVVEFIGHDPADLGRVTDYSVTTYTASAEMEYLSLYVTLTAKIKKGGGGAKQAATAFTSTLGLGKPSKELTKSIGGPIGYTIAYAIKQAIQQGVSFTKPELAAAIAVMVAYTPSAVYWTTTKIDDLVDAASLTSTNVVSNGDAMIAVEPYAKNSLKTIASSKVDPLAETFTIEDDCFLTSVDLFFRVLPESPVTVSISGTVNGIPDDEYLGEVTLDPTSINATLGGLTKFQFDTPIYLEGATEYAFVVLTDDSAAALDVAVLGQTDPTNGLITKNAFTGVMLESANASSWSAVPSTDIKFNLNIAHFSQSESYLALNTETDGGYEEGNVTISDSIVASMFAVNAQWSEPSSDTEVTPQYSLDDGATWLDFVPLLEVDLASRDIGGVKMRLKITSTTTLAPTVVNGASLATFGYLAGGAYVHRRFEDDDAELEFVDVYVDIAKPAGTDVTIFVDFDDLDGFQELDFIDSKVLDSVWTEYHFQFDTSADAKQYVRTKAVLETSDRSVSPLLRRYRVITR